MCAKIEQAYWDEYSNLQRVKHDLIKNYLGGWVPKLALGQFGHGRILYFDTHAGRGRHLQGELGSPLVALQTVLGHSSFGKLSGTEINFFFFEHDEENLDNLRTDLNRVTKPPNVKVHTQCGDCFAILSEIVDRLDENKLRLAPSFVFCDPFGFDIPGSVLRRLMGFRGVELFVNIIWRELDMAIAHARSGKAGWVNRLNSIFDGEGWRSITADMTFDERAEQCVNLIRQMTNATWPTYIRMLGDNRATRYFLLHLTNHDAGRDLMKECMWKSCPAEGYYARKSDNPSQQWLIRPEPDLLPLERWLIDRLRGEPLRWQNLIEEVRPEIWLEKHLNAVVRKLRNDGVLEGTDFQKSFNPSNNPLLSLA